MSGRFKIGTWNLERTGAHHRGRMLGQLACWEERDCDVWVTSPSLARSLSDFASG